MEYDIRNFEIYVEIKESYAQIHSYYDCNGKCVIPDCVRTVSKKLGQDREGNIVAFGKAKINGEVIDLVKPNNSRFWYLNLYNREAGRKFTDDSKESNNFTL